jgi:hypothetical protein
MGRRKKLTNAKFVRQALIDNHGLIALAADQLDVVYNTLKTFVDSDPISQEVIKHCREKRRDRAERRLDDAIEQGEAWAIAMTLKGDPARGYSDKLDVTSGGDKIIVRVVTDDNG